MNKEKKKGGRDRGKDPFLPYGGIEEQNKKTFYIYGEMDVTTFWFFFFFLFFNKRKIGNVCWVNIIIAETCLHFIEFLALTEINNE